MIGVVTDNIPDGLVEEPKERRKRPHAREFHDVLQMSHGVLEALHHQPVRGEVGGEDAPYVALHLWRDGRQFSNRELTKPFIYIHILCYNFYHTKNAYVINRL